MRTGHDKHYPLDVTAEAKFMRSEPEALAVFG